MYVIFCSFVFLQFFDPSQFNNSSERPLLVRQSEAIERAINVFDRIPPYETHRVMSIFLIFCSTKPFAVSY